MAGSRSLALACKGLFDFEKLTFTLIKGNIPEGMMVRHKCDNRKCGDPEHLELGTNKQNMQDRLDRGHQNTVTFSGENNHFSKLTNEKVIELRNRLRSGETTAQVAESMGIDPGTIARAATGRTWGHVPGALPKEFLATKGERSGRVKLSEEQVRQVRERYVESLHANKLAAEFGVSRATISRIVKGESRGDVM